MLRPNTSRDRPKSTPQITGPEFEPTYGQLQLILEGGCCVSSSLRLEEIVPVAYGFLLRNAQGARQM